jgi:phenylpyruvate tautomerase PptA (4-oxalocrotonate tautomerase family)
MPIIEFQIIGNLEISDKKDFRKELINGLANIFGSENKSVWCKFNFIPVENYIENDNSGLSIPLPLPIFLKILNYQNKSIEECKKEAIIISEFVSKVCNRPKENIHILYEPSAKGRIAFGGILKI